MTPETLEITILGSGTSTGVPVVGCACHICSSPSPRNVRTRCSALLTYRGKNILIDTATDFRQQALREGIDHIDAVLFTHAHADHVHGIDDLRVFNTHGGKCIPIYGASPTLAIIQKVFSYIFTDDPEPGWRPCLEPVPVEEPFDLFGLRVVPVPLEHGRYPTQGYRVGPAAYLTDCSGIPESSWPLLQGLELLIVDGLRFRPHTTHFNISQAVAIAQRLGATRTLLTHLSHEVDHERHGKELPDGVELAFDTQKIVLSLAG